MTRKEHYRKNIQLAWPVMLGQLGHVAVGLADSIMIGQLGTLPLAAGAFANAIFVIPMVFGLGMAIGLTTPIANADGENDADRAGSFLKHGLLVNMLTAFLVFCGLCIFAQFTDQLGQEEGVAELAYPYLLIISSSIFPLLLFLTFKQFAEGLSDTRFAMLVSIGSNLVNIALNYFLIYGKWGFPQLGLEGAGYATLLARIIMAVIMALYVFRNKRFHRHIAGFTAAIWKKAHFIKLLKIGVPSGLQYIFEVSAFAIAAILVGRISAPALAAHQIAISLAALSYMAASGIGTSATVRVGNQLGKRDFYNLRVAGHTNFQLALIFMGICGFLFYLGKDWLPGFYTDDPEVINIASGLLVIVVFFQLFDGLQVTVLGALRGMSDVKIPTFITFISYWAVGIGSGYLLGIVYDLGVNGIWYGLALGLVCAALLLFWRFEWKTRRFAE